MNSTYNVEHPERLRIAVFGTGGVGAHFGARLAAVHDVAFIARGAHLRALRENGLRLELDDETIHLFPIEATDDPAAIGPVDLVLVCVKSWQLDDATPRIAPLVGEETLVLPLLNGVEAAEQLAAGLGRAHLLAGLCETLSTLVAPGHVRSLGSHHLVKLGELDNSRSTRVERVRRAFADAGIRVEVPEDIHAALWEKLVLAASTGGVGSLTGETMGVVRSRPETRRMLEESMREVHAVATARGVMLPEDIVARAMATVDTFAPDGMSSLQRDIAAKRPSELEARNGVVVRLGAEAGVPTPVSERIYMELLPLELEARTRHTAATEENR